MSSETNELYQFGAFRLNVAERIFSRVDSQEKVPIPEKAFHALSILIRNQGHLVTKEQLISAIWPDTIVEDNNLEKCISSIRNLLQEKPGENLYIETVRSHGYRFVADVEKFEIPTETLADGSSVDAGAITPAASPKVKPKAFIAIPLLVAALALVFFSFFYPRDTVAVEGKQIAILPLKPIDPANRSDFYEIGIADSLIQRLSSIKGLVVRPLSATRKYTEMDQDPLAAGREQKVDYVVSSNYQIADGRIKVTSQVLDVTTGKVEDTFTVATDAANLFSAQDAIANDIGHRFLAKFGSDNVEFHAKRGTINEEAYRLYLLAANLSEERGVQNVLRSLECLDRAVALDPNYALAWAAKALIHGDIVAHTGGGQHEHFPKSMEAIRKALDVDPSLSDAYSALCHYKNRFEYDFAGAETACKRAVELDPNSSVAHKTNANFLYSRGRFDESISEIRTAIDLQPVSYRNQQIYALALYYARRYPEAEAQFKTLIELNPKQTGFIHGRLIMVLEEQGKESEAFESLVRMLTIQNEDSRKLDRYKAAYRTSGWRGVMAERIKVAEAERNIGNFNMACLRAKMGDKDKAFEYLEKAYQERSFLIAVLQVEPQLDSLRNDTRYTDLVKRIEGK